MARAPVHTPLQVYQNNLLVGHFSKAPGGALSFRYDAAWLERELAFPISLSLPIQEAPYIGAPVAAVFDNLLPDSPKLLQLVARKVGATGTGAFELLAKIGRDCVGALQFLPADEPLSSTIPATVEGTEVSDLEIEALLKNLSNAPLGLGSPDREFRISVAGAQEKTALLRLDERWLKPHGVTPTTHILKTQMGKLPNGMDLTNSVENEYYCLKLLATFGLPVNHAEIMDFGKTRVLVVERFDRQRLANGRLIRLPQEDCCQALSIPPGLKYQSEGGPGMVDILNLLKSGDDPAADQAAFLKAQMLFWLIGATDGHAKNFSLFLGPSGRFRLTPFYDVLTAQPMVDRRKLRKQDLKLAMSVGDNRHYVIEYIRLRHFTQTAAQAKMPARLVTAAFDEISARADANFAALESQLPPGFPDHLHASVHKAFQKRLASARETGSKT